VVFHLEPEVPRSPDPFDLHVLSIVFSHRHALVQDVGEAHEIRFDGGADLFLLGVVVADLLGKCRGFGHERCCILPGFPGCIDLAGNGVAPLPEHVGLDFEFPGTGILFEQVIDPPGFFRIVSLQEICFHNLRAGPYKPDVKHGKNLLPRAYRDTIGRLSIIMYRFGFARAHIPLPANSPDPVHPSSRNRDWHRNPL